MTIENTKMKLSPQVSFFCVVLLSVLFYVTTAQLISTNTNTNSVIQPALICFDPSRQDGVFESCNSTEIRNCADSYQLDIRCVNIAANTTILKTISDVKQYQLSFETCAKAANDNLINADFNLTIYQPQPFSNIPPVMSTNQYGEQCLEIDHTKPDAALKCIISAKSNLIQKAYSTTINQTSPATATALSPLNTNGNLVCVPDSAWEILDKQTLATTDPTQVKIRYDLDWQFSLNCEQPLPPPVSASNNTQNNNNNNIEINIQYCNGTIINNKIFITQQEYDLFVQQHNTISFKRFINQNTGIWELTEENCPPQFICVHPTTNLVVDCNIIYNELLLDINKIPCLPDIQGIINKPTTTSSSCYVYHQSFDIYCLPENYFKIKLLQNNNQQQQQIIQSKLDYNDLLQKYNNGDLLDHSDCWGIANTLPFNPTIQTNTKISTYAEQCNNNYSYKMIPTNNNNNNNNNNNMPLNQQQQCKQRTCTEPWGFIPSEEMVCQVELEKINKQNQNQQGQQQQFIQLNDNTCCIENNISIPQTLVAIQQIPCNTTSQQIQDAVDYYYQNCLSNNNNNNANNNNNVNLILPSQNNNIPGQAPCNSNSDCHSCEQNTVHISDVQSGGTTTIKVLTPINTKTDVDVGSAINLANANMAEAEDAVSKLLLASGGNNNNNVT